MSMMSTIMLIIHLIPLSCTGPCERFGNITQCAINRMELDGSGVETHAIGEQWSQSTVCMHACLCVENGGFDEAPVAGSRESHAKQLYYNMETF